MNAKEKRSMNDGTEVTAGENRGIDRREFLTGTLTGAAASGLGLTARSLFGGIAWADPVDPATADGKPEFHDHFPAHDPDDVRAIVGASHTKFDVVKELVTARPTLAKASWDWGFGDWETALGAASHMGRRDIAELLIEHGARPNLFSAAMMGDLATVRSFVETRSGIQSQPGPHGITLLRHAQAGGEDAAAVVAYLEKVGGADEGPAKVAIDEDELEKYVGKYVFGPGETDSFEVFVDRGLRLKRTGRFARFLGYLGEDTFYPGGGESVRIRFDVTGATPAVEVHDPGLIVRAVRM